MGICRRRVQKKSLQKVACSVFCGCLVFNILTGRCFFALELNCCRSFERVKYKGDESGEKCLRDCTETSTEWKFSIEAARIFLQGLSLWGRTKRAKVELMRNQPEQSVEEIWYSCSVKQVFILLLVCSFCDYNNIWKGGPNRLGSFQCGPH